MKLKITHNDGAERHIAIASMSKNKVQNNINQILRSHNFNPNDVSIEIELSEKQKIQELEKRIEQLESEL